ncbi:ATP-binding protein [Rappaport israeli]|uniref:ATP-binding protein n=1 Tax=Rappaport israeli TaxID=1839807 RepID=UPI000930E170|nr:ATP-binding protein [Rappaport israeli]
MIGVIIYFLALLFIFIRRLFKADEQILEAQQETSEIMQTVQEELFLIDRDLRVSQQHSTALKEILPNIRLSGQTFEELLESILKKKDKLETLKSVAIQLIRNAVVHGIEDSEIRRQNNKNPAGNISVELTEQDNKVELIVRDDGKGIDTVVIKEKLKQLPHFNKDSDAMSTKELFQAIFISGLSTAEQNNEDAGRGVGMDVVKEQVKSIGGALNLRTRKGELTAFTVNLK